MIAGPISSILSLLLGLFGGHPEAHPRSTTRALVQDETVMRVPIQPRPFAPVEWREKKGPKCIPVGALQRAFLSGPRQVDFILADRRRMRAHLDEDCPALDFYGGFYLHVEDERLCAGRDQLNSRMGGSCTIERFKKLVPKIRH